MIRKRPRPRTGRAIRNTMLSRLLILTAMITANTSMIGARNAMRISIWNAFWTLVTSVVSLVTREAVLNLSMFLKEKLCVFSKRPCRRFFEKPIAPTEAILAAPAPKATPPSVL